MFFKKCSLPVLLAVVFVLSGCSDDSGSGTGEAATGQLVVYTSRKEHLIKPLFDRYQAETGVNIQFVTDAAAPLLSRLQAEGENTPADILVTVDGGNLWHAAEEGVLSPVESEVLVRNVPAHLRDAGNRWFAISKRARVIVYSPERVKPGELSSYEALADERWQGRLCLRTSKKVYNQSLVATMIEADGAENTQKVVQGWVDNLATAPFANDIQAMQAVMAGQCDATVVNTYYFGRLEEAMAAKGEQLPLKIFFPNQDGRGIHVNISGAGVTTYAKHRTEAIKFIEWLSEVEAQQMLTDINQEFPVNPLSKSSAEVQAWGTFKEDDVPIEVTGERQAEAVMLMDKAGYR
ncbi:iron(III) transport system substrate-binding protein [Sinobacterium caligoides]|uniref:Iron(III) transport system substrate-binding protein n=1 Tax=Sinobacterium caligoides TaxID=933926 RepID=A0A3N2DHJ2_9GAMM|nr:extracellular solute-binding protein [Sinobacterium caligoides]ROR98854.1 iron(III) transport system substrate-binding protein [Sinobacterium caligoides]